MKIYIVSHYYDNGESYEDYRTYETHQYYSTLEKASQAYWTFVCDDYQGQYKLYEKELDTQKDKLLEESVWLECFPYYYNDPEDVWSDCDDENSYEAWLEEHYYPGGEPKNPEKDIKTAWEHMDWEESLDQCDSVSEEEDRAWLEYVTTPGTNYQEWEEVNEEIRKKKNAILFEELNEILKELC